MTVEGLTTYVTRAEDLADGVVETLNEKSRGVFETEESSTWTDGTELMDFSYAGGYLLTDGSASDASGETEGFTGTDDLFDMGSDVENLLYLVYEVRVQLPENASAGNGTDWFGWGSGYQSLFGTDNDTDNETGGNAEYGTANDAYDDSEDSDAVDEERVKTYYYPVLYRNVMADGSNVYDAGALSYELPGRSTFLGFDTSDQVSFRYGSRTYKYHGFKTLEAAEKSCRDAYDYLYEIETL